jgi:hypothetical protein
MTAIWQRMAGTCLNCRRPFNRNVRLAGGRRWHCPHCGLLQPGPNALAQLVRDREVARLSHAEAQRDYVLERDRRARLRARAEALRAVRNGGTHDPRVGEIRPSG